MAPARLVLIAALTVLALIALADSPGWTAPAPPGRLSAEARDRFTGALTALRSGAFALAARDFAALALPGSPLQDYAFYLKAESLARLGDAPAAREAATRAVDAASDGRVAPLALLLAAEQAARAGDDAGAAALLRRFLDRHRDHPDLPRARYALGHALMAAGEPAEALAVFRALWLTTPASAYAEGAEHQMRVLAQRGFATPPITQREKADRAERLLAAGVITVARYEAETLLNEAPPPDLALRALRVVTEAWRRAGRYDAAEAAATRALAVAPPERRAPWLLDLARLQQRRARDQSLRTLQRLVREYPKSAEVGEAMLLEGRLLEEAARLRDAESVYSRLAAAHSEDDAAGTALWRLGWLSWFRRSYQEAAERWARIPVMRGGQAHREGAMYWAGRAREARGDREAAERHFEQLLSDAPRSYYGLLASARLAPQPEGVTRGTSRAPVAALPADPREPLEADASFARVEDLRAVGLHEYADGEMDEIVRRSLGDQKRLYALSAAYMQESRYHLALRILRRHFVGLARIGHPALPRAFWEMLYPIGWRSELTDAATRASLDPLFVAAVVREESSFHPLARSRVGARGLMQLMPETARPMARMRGLAFNDGDLLNEPGANLELGSAFLGGLLRDFGEPRLAVAAYNAGPTRVREWWAARRSEDLEVWVEQIPYDETRGFVKRVMLSWDEYRRLYGGKP